MPDKKSCKTTLLICILHNHNSDYGTTVGKIEISEDDDEKMIEKNKQKIRAWIDKKKCEHHCADYGDECGVDVRKANTNMRTVGLAIGAEKIE